MMKRNLLKVMALGALTACALASPVEAAPPGDTIVDLAIAANGPGGPYEGMFDTLIAALQAADPSVLSTLSGNGQFTVFAPTDDAFAALNLDPGNIGNLPQSTLTDILLYHVARGRRGAEDVTTSTQIRTLLREFLQVSGTVLTDNLGRTSNIIAPDNFAANGVIHGVDQVVLPYQP
jgi:uncharacterized surface protein with fasciclin (FAS1) repeats